MVRNGAGRHTVASRRLRGQRGFTLIELLVVTSILGVLAAIVTMSMLGMTALANRRADEAELKIVQGAVDGMVADQMIDQSQACTYSGPPTNDMKVFPSANAYVQSGGTGEVGQHPPVAVYPAFIRQRHTKNNYTCSNGRVVKS